MTISLTDLKPGDVIVTATVDKGGWWIRARSWLTRAPNLHNHVALFTHLDDTGRPRGLEGRPSGFGWANLDKYLNHPDSVSNARQSGRTDAARDKVVTAAVEMVGIPYDWAAILAFAATTARLPFLVREWPDDGVPSHTVCSSSLDYLYESVGWDNPGGYTRTRGTDPDDWTRFIQVNRY
jgi:hypothetical protein